jgi:hypothetical protein
MATAVWSGLAGDSPLLILLVVALTARTMMVVQEQRDHIVDATRKMSCWQA